MSESDSKKQDDCFASEVAEHYNRVEQTNIKERKRSDIIELRKFNNAMKSLMHFFGFKYAATIPLTQTDTRKHYRVLDLGCGKGGDLPKYLRNDQVDLVVGVDVADISIQQCKERYNSMKRSNKRNFRGEFFVADLTRVDISKKLLEFNLPDKFHIVSSQFSIHYSFESFEQAIRYIKNGTNNLIKHGLFIGTYPDGPKLLKLARESKTPGLYEVDDILSVRFEPEHMNNPKPFGTKYHFKLKEAVDCPEFLVHPEVLRKLFSGLGCYEVWDKSFEECLTDAITNGNDGNIVKNIFYNHDALKVDEEHKCASLDLSTWRAASIYRCFCYRTLN